MTATTDTPEWAALVAHRDAVEPRHLRELFAAEPGRVDALTIAAGDLVVDLSKQRITSQTPELLAAVARRAGLAQRTSRSVTGGQPAGETEILVTGSYRAAFEGLRNYSLAATYGVVILALLVVYAAAYRRALQSKGEVW